MHSVVGNEHARDVLVRAFTSGQVRHAYLFAGPESVGKTTLALAFAQLLECEQPNRETDDPCGVCVSCRRVAHGNHPDVTLIEPDEGKRLVGIDAVREGVVRMANRTSSGAGWRIFILPNVERMTAATVNALLKTLEEPPPGVVLLLTSAEPENLLPTLLSRCQLVSLVPLANADVQAALEQRWEVAHDEAVALAELASGRFGWAVRAHEHPELCEQRAQHLALLLTLTSASRDERLRHAGTLATDGEVARRVLELWTLWWRDVTLAACGATNLMSGGVARREAERQGQALGEPTAQAFLRALLGAQAALDQNASARLTFDVLMLDLPYLPAVADRRR